MDCVAFAHLAQFVYVPFDDFKRFFETETPNLLAFVERVKTKYWQDWEEICSSLDLNTHLPKKEVPETNETNDEAKKQEKAEKKKLAVINPMSPNHSFFMTNEFYSLGGEKERTRREKT